MGQHLAELSFVQTFVCGWFALRFTGVEHTHWVLSSFLHMEQARVLLRRWSPLFNPEREQLRVGPLWVRLPGLPLQFWFEDIFRRIGNSLDTSLEFDKSYLSTGIMDFARISVHIDIREGLQEQVTLCWRNFTQTQILDYEWVLFRCRRCHKVVHLYKDCPLIGKVRNGHKGKIVPTKNPRGNSKAQPFA